MKILLPGILFVLVAAVHAAPAPAPAPAILDMAHFFSGNWDCRGKLSNGKELDADIGFTSELDGQALVFRQRDRPPGHYVAVAIWTIDRSTGKLVSFMQDNSGGARYFLGDDWNDGKLTLVDNAILGHKPWGERFRYERRDADTFEVFWELATPAGDWRVGDSSLCRREKQS